jgi:hypothetical protein
VPVSVRDHPKILFYTPFLLLIFAQKFAHFRPLLGTANHGKGGEKEGRKKTCQKMKNPGTRMNTGFSEVG